MKVSLFQGILLGTFVLGALIGLFVFATYTNTNSGGNTVGTVVIWGTLSESAMQKTLISAGQSNEAFKSVSYVQKDPATLSSELATAIATGNSPDLVLASHEELYALAQFLMPIPFATLPVRTFSDTFASANEVFLAPGGSGYFGIPFLIDPLVLFSNRAILATSGVARPPSTWEALVGLVSQVTTLTSSRQISRGLIALGTYSNVHNARGILSALFLQQNIPLSSYGVSGNLSANLGVSTGSGTPPGPAVVGFFTQFADPSKTSYTWNSSLPDSQQEFISGDLALYLGYASEARYLRAANPNLDFIATPLPQPATARLKSAYGLMYAFMIPRGALNSAGGYQIASLLTGSAEQVSASTNTGLAPATLSELAVAPADPTLAVAYATALYTKGWLSPAPTDTDAIFSGMISTVISGRSNSETALTTAERSFNAILQR